MRRCQHNWFDLRAVNFPRTGFWLIHIIGALAFFGLGMRFAMRRAPLSFIVYRVMRMLAHR